MEIKRISDESYESINAYLNKMLTMTREFNDLSFARINHTEYVVNHVEDYVYFVKNDNGELKRFYIGKENEILDAFWTDEFHYQLFESKEKNVKDVTRTNNKTHEKFRLTYLPAIENYPKDMIKFLQVLSSGKSLEYRYDVTSRDNIVSAIAFCMYHYPDVFRLTDLKKLLFFYYKKNYDYALGEDEDDTYYRPFIKIGQNTFGSRKTPFNAETLIPEICECGFEEKIPGDMMSLLSGNNYIYKELELVKDEYQKTYTKRIGE